jgi:hypothetical protein
MNALCFRVTLKGAKSLISEDFKEKPSSVCSLYLPFVIGTWCDGRTSEVYTAKHRSVGADLL